MACSNVPSQLQLTIKKTFYDLQCSPPPATSLQRSSSAPVLQVNDVEQDDFAKISAGEYKPSAPEVPPSDSSDDEWRPTDFDGLKRFWKARRADLESDHVCMCNARKEKRRCEKNGVEVPHWVLDDVARYAEVVCDLCKQNHCEHGRGCNLQEPDHLDADHAPQKRKGCCQFCHHFIKAGTLRGALYYENLEWAFDCHFSRVKAALPGKCNYPVLMHFDATLFYEVADKSQDMRKPMSMTFNIYGCRKSDQGYVFHGEAWDNLTGTFMGYFQMAQEIMDRHGRTYW